jgi:phosphate uptake regulator
MLRELLSILRSTDPLRAMRDNFARMVQTAREMTIAAGDIYFGKSHPVNRAHIYETDVRVNQLERVLRKQIVTHLSLSEDRCDLPYCLLLMSLVKDVERIGDYAKNLSEVEDFCHVPLPEDDIRRELSEIRQGVERAFESTTEVLDASDIGRALELIRQGRDISRRCELLVRRIAGGSCEACVTTAQVLGCRYYKRIDGHVLNILSSVVMPLHKVDYYDEDEVALLRNAAR